MIGWIKSYLNKRKLRQYLLALSLLSSACAHSAANKEPPRIVVVAGEEVKTKLSDEEVKKLYSFFDKEDRPALTKILLDKDKTLNLKIRIGELQKIEKQKAKSFQLIYSQLNSFLFNYSRVNPEDILVLAGEIDNWGDSERAFIRKIDEIKSLGLVNTADFFNISGSDDLTDHDVDLKSLFGNFVAQFKSERPLNTYTPKEQKKLDVLKRLKKAVKNTFIKYQLQKDFPQTWALLELD